MREMLNGFRAAGRWPSNQLWSITMNRPAAERSEHGPPERYALFWPDRSEPADAVAGSL